MKTRALLPILCAVVVACGSSRPADPVPTGVTPKGAYAGSASHATISGTGLIPSVSHRLGGETVADDRFGVEIASREMTGVAWRGDVDGGQVLEADVPADLPVGVWDVQVRNPSGGAGTLRSAWKESAGPPPKVGIAGTPEGAVEVGVAFTLDVTLTNAGAEAARVEALTIAGVAAGPLPVLVGAGETVTLTVQVTAPAVGGNDLPVGMVAFDDLTGAALAVETPPVHVVALAPAALSVVLANVPANVEDGEPVTVDVAVSNTGQVSANAVVLSTAARIDNDPAPAPVTIGPGITVHLPLTLRNRLPTIFDGKVQATGTDAISGAAVSAKADVTATVVAPAALSITSVSAPSSVDHGQAFTVSITVTNTGGAPIVALAPAVYGITGTGGAAATATLATTPSPATSLAPNQSTTIAWQCAETGTLPGSLTLVVGASGTDAVWDHAPVPQSQVTISPIVVQQPAALLAAASPALSATPATIDAGQSFTVALAIQNQAGAATAKSVTPALTLTPGGGATATTSSAPAAVDLAGNASASFAWAYTAGANPGTLSFSVHTTAVDANTGATIARDDGPFVVTVQSPAAFNPVPAWSPPPASVAIGDTFTTVLTVTNGGDAAADSVSASATVSGTGSLTGGARTPSAAIQIAGHSSATFTWTWTAAAAGNVQIASTVTGIDHNTGTALAPVSATSSAIAIAEVATVAVNPFNSDGTTFAYLMSYGGSLYAGPNAAGTGMVRLAPDGSTPLESWQLEVNTNPMNAARNAAYQSTPPTLCHTIGAAGCASNTTQCGPDNESGRGIFTSGFVGSTEWYVVTGASPNVGGARYLYMTNASFPLAVGGYDDLAFVQIQATQGGSTRMVSAAHFFNDRLYLGFLDGSGTGPNSSKIAPVLNVLTKMPSLPGYTAAAGTDLVDLGGVNLPSVGAIATGSSTTWLMIDTIAHFNGLLYVGNSNGWARSTNGMPGTCTNTSCADWTSATPSSGDYSAKNSVVPSASTVGTLDNSGRALAGMVAFGGRLFAARNTTQGPQLWSCAPSSGGACNPGDWRMVAKNTSGDLQLSQFNDTNNKAITLLAASTSHLYVGFNNPNGVQVWRTANPGVTNISEFTGQNGVSGGTGGAQGIGGNGFGANVVAIFDGRALTFNGSENVFLTAATSGGAPRVYRLTP